MPKIRADNFMTPPFVVRAILPYAQSAQGVGAALLRSILDPGIQALAMAIHGNEQRTESVDAEFPQRFRIEVVEVDVFDGLDPGGLERGGAADDGDIRSAEVLERLERVRA